MQRAVLAAVGRAGDEQLLALLDDFDVARDALESSPLGPFTRTDSGSIATVTPAGTGIGCLPILDIDLRWGPSYQTWAMTSPPTPAARASWPVITPREVETIEVPIPPCTLGIRSACT